MSIIDNALEANRSYAKDYDPTLAKHPAPQNRSCNLHGSSSLRPSCNPGSAASRYRRYPNRRTRSNRRCSRGNYRFQLVLGSREILILNHTGCGFTTFTDEELNAKLSASTGDTSPAPMRFFSYKDPEENTREQIKKVRSHPWIAKDVPVRGVVFDMGTGRLREVKVLEQERAA
jgi:carbonic anhydrase